LPFIAMAVRRMMLAAALLASKVELASQVLFHGNAKAAKRSCGFDMFDSLPDDATNTMAKLAFTKFCMRGVDSHPSSMCKSGADEIWLDQKMESEFTLDQNSKWCQMMRSVAEAHNAWESWLHIPDDNEKVALGDDVALHAEKKGKQETTLEQALCARRQLQQGDATMQVDASLGGKTCYGADR